MHRPGHVGAALLGYSPLGFFAAAVGAGGLAVLAGAAAVALAMVPDLDQQVPGLRHRGFTHTLVFALIVAIVTGLAGGVIGGILYGLIGAVGVAIFGFLVGGLTVCSHILADMLTPAGVRPFRPWVPHRYTYNLARASNPVANALLLVIGGAVALLAVVLGSSLHAAV